MPKVHYIKESRHYQYALRSCTNCTNETICNESKAEGSMWLDCARCSCKNYHNDSPKLMREKPRRCEADD